MPGSDHISSNLNKLPSHSRKQGSSDHNGLADKQEFIGRYKKLMLMLINAPTPDRPFLESFPTLAGSPAVGPGAAGTDSSWRKRSSLRPDESIKVNREVTAVSQMLLDWNWTWSYSRELFIGMWLLYCLVYLIVTFFVFSWYFFLVFSNCSWYTSSVFSTWDEDYYWQKDKDILYIL